jgi:hypothetical protein
VLDRVLQYGRANSRQLRIIELGRTTAFGYRAQCINAAFIEKTLPCVYRLASYAHRIRNFGTSLARKQ